MFFKKPLLSGLNEPARVNSAWLEALTAVGWVLTTNMPWPVMARSVGEEVWVVDPCWETSCWVTVVTPPAEKEPPVWPVTRDSKSTLSPL